MSRQKFGAPYVYFQLQAEKEKDMVYKRTLLYAPLYFLCSFFVVSALFALLRQSGIEGGIFSPSGSGLFRIPRQFPYPHPYLALVCFCYSLLAARSAPRMAGSGSRPWLQAARVVVAAPLLASPLIGVLWQFFDMLSGYFPGGILAKLARGLLLGPFWALPALSMHLPLVFLCIALAVPGTVWLSRKLYGQRPEKPGARYPPGMGNNSVQVWFASLIAFSLGLFCVSFVLDASQDLMPFMNNTRYYKLCASGSAEDMERFLAMEPKNARRTLVREASEARAEEKYTPLEVAATNPDPGPLRVLLRRGALTARAWEGTLFSALGAALCCDRVENALLLLKTRAATADGTSAFLKPAPWRVREYVARKQGEKNLTAAEQELLHLLGAGAVTPACRPFTPGLASPCLP